MLLLMIDDRCSPNLVWVDGICCRSDGHWRRRHDLSCVSWSGGLLDGLAFLLDRFGSLTGAGATAKLVDGLGSNSLSAIGSGSDAVGTSSTGGFGTTVAGCCDNGANAGNGRRGVGSCCTESVRGGNGGGCSVLGGVCCMGGDLLCHKVTCCCGRGDC